MAQKFLSGLHVSGSTQIDFMPTHESEGIITLGRYDSNTSRYHNIKSYVSSTSASNYLKFSLHGGTTNTVADVLTLKGDLSATFASNVTINTTGVTNNLILTSTDTSTASAPDIVLYRNAAIADNDTSGVVEFRGRNAIGGSGANTADISYGAIYSRMVDVLSLIHI